jgi:type IV secretion system protein VirD4
VNSHSQKSANIVFLFITVLAFWLGNRAFALYSEAIRPPDTQRQEAVIFVFQNLLRDLSSHPVYLKLSKDTVLVGLCCAGIVLAVWLYYMAGNGARRPGEEYGSTRWGTLREAKRFANRKTSEQNIILSKHIRMTTERPKDFTLDRNLNVTYIAGSGGGKTTGSVIPNAWQYNGSYVYTDPKSTLLPQLGQGFLDHGYHVTTFNTMKFGLSMHYNPLAYIEKEDDILGIVNVLMENTSGQGEKKNEDFWVKSERMWLQAHIGYLWMQCPEDLNFGGVLQLLEASSASEENENAVTEVDHLFAELEKKCPGNFACKCYTQYKKAAGKTAKSILVSVAARLTAFSMPGLREITSYDEMNLDDIGVHKTALFIGVSATNTTYDFLVAMLLYQLMDRLTTEADIKFGGELPIRVQLFLDEFANCIGKIPNFEKTIAVIRSQKINAWIYLQSMSQLSSLYGKDAANVILDNCDWLVFGGGKSVETTEQLSKMMGKQTIKGRNHSESKGQQGSYSTQDQGLGRDLLDPSEIGRLPRTKCLVLCTNEYPYIDDKFSTFTDKRYKEMKKNKLDVAQWIRCGMPAKPPDKEQMEKAHIAASIDAGTGEVYIGKDTVKILSSIKNNHT